MTWLGVLAWVVLGLVLRAVVTRALNEVARRNNER
jgi:hypothetical protein